MFDERQFNPNAEGVLEPKTVIAYFTELSKKMDDITREAEKLHSTVGYGGLTRLGMDDKSPANLVEAVSQLKDVYDKSLTAVLSATNRLCHQVELQGEQINQLQKSLNSLKRKPTKKTNK